MGNLERGGGGARQPKQGASPLYHNSSRFEGRLGGDALGVQCMDVLASGKHSGVPDGVTPWARLHILAL